MGIPRSTLATLPVCPKSAPDFCLEDVLSESVARVKRRERMQLDQLLADRHGECVLFGAGSMGRRALAGLRDLGVEPRAFSDNNPLLWGTHIDGLPVLAPDLAVRRFGADAHFFITIRNEAHCYRDTQQQLQQAGCFSISSAEPIAWRFPDRFPPFLLYDLPHKLYQQAAQVLAAGSIWADEASRQEYFAQIRLRALGDPSALSRFTGKESYILDDVFDLEPDDAFLDCGAFDGDTIRALIARPKPLGRIEAVEADSHSFARLASTVSELDAQMRQRVRLHNCAVGSQLGPVRFEDTGKVDSKLSSEGEMIVDMVPIDVMFRSKRVSMIKMDIEGGEFDALTGAAQVIRRDRPILAICVYHCQQDLWRLPLLMRSLNPDYQMYLKSYRGDGIQTVAYAVPPERVLGPQAGPFM